MEMPTIRMVPDDVNLWLVYAGLRRRHLDLFLRSRSIFLELPGFAANEDTFADDAEIRRHLTMSSAIRRWALHQDGDPPSRRSAAYEPPAHEPGSPEARGFSAEVGNIYRMFCDIKPGDLVLSPPIGHYKPFLIGEVTEPWRPDQVLAVPFFDNEEVPVRKVRWLSGRIARRDFPSNLARNLQNQHAVSQVDPVYTETVLRLVYQNFAWRQKSKLNVYGNNYTGQDPLQLNETAFLIKYSLAAVSSFYDGTFDEFQQLPPGQAIKRFYDARKVEHFRVNFNSPGKFEAIFAAKSASSLLSALIALATSRREIPLAQAKEEVREQVKGAIKGIEPHVRSDIDRLIEALSDDRWEKIRDETGIPADEELDITLDERMPIDGENGG